MKPEGEVARRRDYETQRIAHAEAAAMVVRHHYSRSCGNTSTFAFGLFQKTLAHHLGHAVLAGASLWLPPARGTVKQLVRERSADASRILACSRFVLRADEPKNTASLFLAGCEREIRRDGAWRLLVSYADTWREHEGAIYRAAGWTRVGLTPKREVWVGADGRQVSRITHVGRSGGGKALTTTLNRRELEARGCVLVGRFAKLRFVKEI